MNNFTKTVVELQHNERGHGRSDKDKFQGGGDKPMTIAQKEMIIDKCNKMNIDCSELCICQCGKVLDSFNGGDANKIIKHLKSIPNPRNRLKQR